MDPGASRACGVLVLVMACGASGEDAGARAVAAGAPPETVAAQVAPRTEQAPAEPVTPPVAAPAKYSGPIAATGVDAGVMVVWARASDDAAGGSEIAGLLLDARGIEVGAPRVIHRAQDEVVALAADRRDGDAWVAWVREGEDAEAEKAWSEIGAVTVAADLSKVGQAIALRRFDGHALLEWGSEAAVRVVDRADGGAAVAAGGGGATCKDKVRGRGQVPCPGFDLFRVKADGEFERARHFGVEGGQPELGSLVDVGVGVMFDVWAWRGGLTTAQVFARDGKAAGEPPFALPRCRPPLSRGWTGAEFVTLCPGDDAAEGERCPEPGEEGLCARVHAVRLDGSRVTPSVVPVTSQVRRCQDGRPVVEVAWEGGRLQIDPRQTRGSLALDVGVWTGSHAIAVARDGGRERWGCTPDGEFVLEERLAPLALASP